MQYFFKQLNFTNVAVYLIDVFESTEYAKYDLVVFDNRDLPFESDKLEKPAKAKIKQRTAKMDVVVKASSKFIIHYGNRLNWVNDNRDRVQAANFQFSLYARIKEMLDFMDAYLIRFED